MQNAISVESREKEESVLGVLRLTVPVWMNAADIDRDGCVSFTLGWNTFGGTYPFELESWGG